MLVPYRQQGFSMIEVLVSLVILSFAILGVGSLQIMAIKGTQSAHLRTQASIAAMNLASKMRANPSGVALGKYQQNTAITCTTTVKSCFNTACTYSELATYDKHQVACGHRTSDIKSGGIAEVLPLGTLKITCDTGTCARDSVHFINIQWYMNEPDPSSQSNNKIYSIQLPVTL